MGASDDFGGFDFLHLQMIVFHKNISVFRIIARF